MSGIGLNLYLSVILNKTANGKQEKRSIGSEEELSEYLMDKISDNSESMSDEDKEKMRARIEAKLKAGKKLSAKEVDFLKENDPQLYMQYQRIRAMADNMVSQLKHAKTKQQANDIITTSMSSVSDKDPYKEYILAAMNEAAKEFKKSPEYKRLPDSDSDRDQKKTAPAKRVFEGGADEQADDFDPMTWTPLQDIIDSLPAFHVSA